MISSNVTRMGLFKKSLNAVSSFKFKTGNKFHTSRLLSDVFNIQDEDDFKSKVIDNKKPAIVQFTAPWCGPCKQLTPRLEAAVLATNEKIDLARVDVDGNEEIAMNYSVASIPTVISFKDGKIVEQFIGLRDADEIDKFIKKLL